LGLGSDEALAQPSAPRHGAHPAARRAQIAALTKFRFDHAPAATAAGGPAFVAATAADGDLDAQCARPDARRRVADGKGDARGKRPSGEIDAEPKRVRFDVSGRPEAGPPS
jgi:hypothetical protein